MRRNRCAILISTGCVKKLVLHKADVRQCYDITVYHHVLGHEFTTIPQQKSFKKLAVYNTI